MEIDDAGLWCQIDYPDHGGRAALFLDRDGVVCLDTNYLGRPEDLHLVEGSAPAIARCNTLGIPIVLVTNQSGIARGYYGWDGFQAVQTALAAALASAGAHLDAVLACAYHPQGHEPLRMSQHPWRKPNPGMILEAASRMNLDLSSSWIVGDRIDDIAAGKAANLAGGVLVLPAGLEHAQAQSLANDRFIVETAPNLGKAVDKLMGMWAGGLLNPIGAPER
jgi:D-glycero-D-manno-heptose 1,7-bisphosphate phosphatase